MNVDRSWLKKHSYFKKNEVNKKETGFLPNPAAAIADELDNRGFSELTGKAVTVYSFMVCGEEIKFKDLSTNEYYIVDFDPWMNRKEELRSDEFTAHNQRR